MDDTVSKNKIRKMPLVFLSTCVKTQFLNISKKVLFTRNSHVNFVWFLLSTRELLQGCCGRESRISQIDHLVEHVFYFLCLRGE